RDELIAKINQRGNLNDYNAPSPVVTVEEFFDGNTDLGSIGCNLPQHPGLEHFHRVLNEIRFRPDVQDVLVRIYDIEDDDWPFTDTVYILTSAPKSEVERWVESLQPSEVHEDGDDDSGQDWQSHKSPSAPDLKPGMRAVY